MKSEFMTLMFAQNLKYKELITVPLHNKCESAQERPPAYSIDK